MLCNKIDEKFKTLEKLYKRNIPSEDLRLELNANNGPLIPYNGHKPPTVLPSMPGIEPSWTREDPKTPRHSMVEGRFYYVPDGWSLPRKMCNFRTAWELYCIGQPMYKYTSPRTEEVKIAQFVLSIFLHVK